jgi:hypothetical protein
MKKIHLLIVSLFMATSMGLHSIHAQSVNYKVHALFLYKFTQYIEWPAANSSYVIGVVGNSPILEELQNLANTRKNLVIKKLTATSDMSGCQLIFVSENSSNHLATISSKVSGKPVLIISETGSGAKKGAGINFVLIDDKMKFELNKGIIEHQGLKVSGDLVSLSIIVG